MLEIELIHEVLDSLRPWIQDHYARRDELVVETKRHPNDLLTEVDVDAQTRIVDRIRRACPADSIVAEEAGFDVLPENRDARCWFVDPIDGTQNFVRGLFPAFGVSIAFSVAGRPLAGAVDFPVSEDRFWATRNGGGWRNGSRLSVSDIDELSVGRVEIEYSSRDHRESTLTIFHDLIRDAGQLRCSGAAVAGLCSVASGDLDAYAHIRMNPWDIAAALLIIEESGGRVTRLDGSPVNLFDSPAGVLASNAFIHEACLERSDTE